MQHMHVESGAEYTTPPEPTHTPSDTGAGGGDFDPMGGYMSV